MKKSLIALAVLGAFTGVAQAQSSVTLYGIVDTYVGRTKAGAPGAETSTTVLNSGGLSTSRWGVKGEEDLGGGLKAVFKLEQRVNADNGTTTADTAFDRQAYVGLAGGFGEVQIGNVWSAFDDVFYIGNPLFDSFVFAPGAANYSLGGNPVMASYNYNDKPRNAIRYTSPSFGGFSGAVSYGLKEAGTVSQTDFNIAYAGGPISAALAYQVQDNANGAGSDDKFTYASIAYDLGVAVIKAGYGTTRNVIASKTDDYQVGVDFPLSSALTLSAGYASSKDKDGSDVKRNGYAFGANYKLSKRTDFYAAYNNSKEKTAGTTTEKFSFFGAGIRHSF